MRGAILDRCNPVQEVGPRPGRRRIVWNFNDFRFCNSNPDCHGRSAKTVAWPFLPRGSRLAFTDRHKCITTLSMDGPGGTDADTGVEKGPDECQ
jgi:hypothetical protein